MLFYESCCDCISFISVIAREISEWNNEGECKTSFVRSDGLKCGPGTQRQTRICTDGSIETCASIGTERNISCDHPEANTALPHCSGK